MPPPSAVGLAASGVGAGGTDGTGGTGGAGRCAGADEASPLASSGSSSLQPA
jgi:hypothetical protein